MTLPKCAICEIEETPEAILIWKEFDDGSGIELVHEECFERMVLKHT